MKKFAVSQNWLRDRIDNERDGEVTIGRASQSTSAREFVGDRILQIRLPAQLTFSVSELAKVLSRSESTVRRWIANHEIKARKNRSGQWTVEKTEVRKIILKKIAQQPA